MSRDGALPTQSCPPPPSSIPGFALEHTLAQGGFGTLLAARRERDGLRVALKVAHRTGVAAEEGLKREAQALRAIGPPTVPELYETGRLAGGPPFLVMQLISHPLLSALLARQAGPLPGAGALALALVDALATIHHRGFIHCDLKPENLFVNEAAGTVGMFDFGLARQPRAPESGRRPGGLVRSGSAGYMAPEQCAGEEDLDARTDIYATGVILYELFTGRRPFAGPAADVMQAHLSHRPPRPRALASEAPRVEEVVLRCLAKERSRRYGSAEELAEALRQALEQPLVAGAEPSLASAVGAPEFPSQSVAVLLLCSDANPLLLQKVLAHCGGQLAFHQERRIAAVFDPERQPHPLRYAWHAAERMLREGLATAAQLDVTTLRLQRRVRGPHRYLGACFLAPDSYPTAERPHSLLVTAAAARLLPELVCVPVPGREGLLRKASPLAATDVPPFELTVSPGAMVGRAGELRTLVDSALAAVREGVPTVATVSGDVGQGKSHLASILLQRLRELLPPARLLPLRAQAPIPGAREGSLLLLLLRRLLDLEGKPAAEAEAVAHVRCEALLGPDPARELWPALASCLGWPSGMNGLRGVAAAPGALRSLLVRAAGTLLAASARVRPVLLLLDDAHAADPLALDAIGYATRAGPDLPLWVCALARPGFEPFPSRSTTARHLLLTLEALAPEEAVALCREELHPARSVPTEALERLAERARRTPLFIIELVRGLKRQGVVSQGPGGSWYLATDELERVPDSHLLEWLALRELGTLPEELAAHARLCAVLCTNFTLDEVEGVVRELEREGGADDFPLDARHATRRLVEQGLLVAWREGVCFRNELLREAVARTLSEPRRARVHRAAHRYYVSETGERQRLPRRAFHAAAAGLHEQAAALYIELAAAARSRHAYLEAESTYSRALELLPGEDGLRRLAALRGRGRMRYRVGRYEDSLKDLALGRELARRLERALDEAELLLDEATALDWTNDYARSRECVEEARALCLRTGLDTPLLKVRLLLGTGRSHFRHGEWARAGALLEAAAAEAHALGHAGYESRVIALLLLGFILPHLGRIDDAGRVLEECITACAERGDRLHLGSAINNRRNLWVARGDLARAVEDQEHFMRLGRELGTLGWEYFAEHNLGELHYQAGDTAAATPHILRAMALERGHPEVATRPWSLLLWARLQAWEGQVDTARQALADIQQALARHPGSALSRSEAILFRLVDLSTRPARDEEWQELQALSDVCSVEQEPLEVLELQALARLRRGERQQAVALLSEALRRAEMLPNVMRARLRRSLNQALAAAQ